MCDARNTAVFDVLVVGAGIAGCEAALAAAESGARVALASAGPTFSGSSFFPGTWGLGLVGPAGGHAGEKDLEAAILEVGRGMALPPLVHALVAGTGEAVERLDARGVELRRAERAGERDFIPCFDCVHRSWHGLARDSYRRATDAALGRAGVERLPRRELLDLVEKDGRVCGALLAGADGAAHVVGAGAVVLATGGFGGLFSRTLTMPDVSGAAAGVALRHGAQLVNVEFIQIMPGLVEPVRDVVFNERTFRYARVEGVGGPGAAELLDARGGHGPFTASLPDRAVDLALAAAGPAGAAVAYDLPNVLPEFMQTYFDWFEGTYGRRPDRDVRIAPYAHASNGGILVDERGGTGVDGLFACGEATGGMHGADRIGGLSSANGLVFGAAAGWAAAAWAAGHAAGATIEAEVTGAASGAAAGRSPREREALLAVRQVMTERCLLNRTAEGLEAAARALGELEAGLGTAGPTRAGNALLSARALVTTMLTRTESRGAHYRADFPREDPAQARPLVVALDGSGHPVASARSSRRAG